MDHRLPAQFLDALVRPELLLPFGVVKGLPHDEADEAFGLNLPHGAIQSLHAPNLLGADGGVDCHGNYRLRWLHIRRTEKVDLVDHFWYTRPCHCKERETT